MKAFLPAVALACLPVLAMAQNATTVEANASAAASMSSGASPDPGSGAAAIPPGLPPPVRLLAPSASLNPKEMRGVVLARRWASARYLPHAGADGVIRYPFGATLATVVCAPLQICDLALQPSEVVNNVNAGDKEQWSIMPGMSGSPDGNVTHLLIKPRDAGLVSSMTILTNRRSYSVKLVSTQAQWMPHVGFTYPDEQQQAWSAYQASTGAGMAVAGIYGAGGSGGNNLAFYNVDCEGAPSWKPLRAWTDGIKTYVEFSGPLNSGAPALVGLASDGGWFSHATEQVVNYRPVGNRYVADAALPRAALISGVGGAQQRCTLTREAAR